MHLQNLIANHIPFNDEEARHQQSFLQFFEKFEEKDWATRENMIGHLTSTAWVVNPARTKVLFAFHNIYQSWAWLGGHADGDLDLLHVALKEAKEESGIQSARVLQETPFDIGVQTVMAHTKKGIFIPPHLHYNVVYLLEADEDATLQHKADENAGVAWLDMDTLFSKINEEYMVPTYQRIMDKLKQM